MSERYTWNAHGDIFKNKEIFAYSYSAINAEHICKELNKQEKQIQKLEQEIHIKNDLIQQQRNELNTDPYKNVRKYRKEFMRVCEELADANITIKQLKIDIESNKEE